LLPHRFSAPQLSQETLAEMIGTTRLRVSYFMNKFRELGLISYNGKIEIHNSLLSAVLHEKPEIERDDPTGTLLSTPASRPIERRARRVGSTNIVRGHSLGGGG
jgi:hypothetical protein